MAIQWSQILDVSIFVAIINLINTAANIVLSIRLKAIQTNREILNDLRDQNLAKDEIIATLKKQKESISKKYHELRKEAKI